MIKIKIKGLKEAMDKFDYISSALKTEIAEAIAMAALLVESKAKPVTPVLTGRLRASIRPDYIRPTEAAIAPHTEYAAAVHEGKGSSYRKGPRPFMVWGAEAALGDIEKVFQAKINEALRK